MSLEGVEPVAAGVEVAVTLAEDEVALLVVAALVEDDLADEEATLVDETLAEDDAVLEVVNFAEDGVALLDEGPVVASTEEEIDTVEVEVATPALEVWRCCRAEE